MLVTSISHVLVFCEPSEVCIEVSHELEETGYCGRYDGVIELRLRPCDEHSFP